MTTAELVDELRRKLGNRTDIADDRLVRWLNWSMLDLCGFHRQRVFPSVWFHELEEALLLHIVPESGYAQAGADLTITLAASASDVADRFNDTVVAITGYDEVSAVTDTPEGLVGQERLITDYTTARVATVDSEWDVNPDEYTEYTIYRRKLIAGVHMPEDFKTNVYAILKLEYAKTGSEVEHVAWESLAHSDPMATGNPGKYSRHGDTLIFDSAPTEPVVFRAWVYNYPPQLDVLVPTGETILPDQWDEVILLGALWRGFESLMEPDRATEAKQQYVDSATNKNSTYAVEAPHIERGIRVRRNY